MSKIEGMQDPKLEQPRELTADLQEYVSREPFWRWPHVYNMRRVVAEQLLHVEEVEE